MKLLLDTDIGNDIDDFAEVWLSNAPHRLARTVDADAFFRIWFGVLA